MSSLAFRSSFLALSLLAACGSDSVAPDASSADGGTDADVLDAAQRDAMTFPPPLDHCDFSAVSANAVPTTGLEAAALRAGAAERFLSLPFGSGMGGYSNRAGGLGAASQVDGRTTTYAGKWVPSYGVETRPRVKALALSAGGETIVLLKADLIMADDNATQEVARRLGPEFAGKVVFATSHSHAQLAQYSSNLVMSVGLGPHRGHAYGILVDTLEAAAREALEGLEDASIAIAHDANFDPDNLVTHDRRSENDVLPNGANRKDRDLYVMRVDRADGSPLAIVPIFGVHGTMLDSDNNYASTDIPGAIERALEEQFSSDVVVMHLQGSGGDVSPAGSDSTDCSLESPICYNFANVEAIGRRAVAPILATWEAAEADLSTTTVLEMVTNVVPLGPDASTFTVRDGALAYLPFDADRRADGVVYDDAMNLLSPIDEFNAPYGAAFCGEPTRSIAPRGQLPGTERMIGYGSCSRVDALAPLVGALLGSDLGTTPVCGSTRTTISAFRIGDHRFATVPGEPVTLLADHLRELAGGDASNTVVIGYAQGHVGYVLTPEDWVLGGYEPSINIWGPLEGEYIAERAADLVALLTNGARENGMAPDATVFGLPPDTAADLEPDAAPLLGTVPPSVPAIVYARGAGRITAAEPNATISRLGTARFVWIGEDPLAGTPTVSIERETSPGSGFFDPLVRPSGRVVNDADMLVSWTPDPLRQEPGVTRTHYWAVEWQAVPPADSRAPLTASFGLETGRYRIRVVGTGYDITSRVFEVVPAVFEGTAVRSGSSIDLAVATNAEHGFRLVASSGPSNGRINVSDRTVEVRLVHPGGEEVRENVALDGNGRATLTDVPTGTTQVVVADAFENGGEIAVSAE